MMSSVEQDPGAPAAIGRTIRFEQEQRFKVGRRKSVWLNERSWRIDCRDRLGDSPSSITKIADMKKIIADWRLRVESTTNSYDK